MQSNLPVEFLERLAKGLAAQFGSGCEIVVHDMRAENTILIIENGHVSGRKVGDGPSHVVLDALSTGHDKLHDQIAYLTKTHDGRILKSTTIYIRNDQREVTGIFSINYDITGLMAAQNALSSITNHVEEPAEPSRIPQNVGDLLDELIAESLKYAGNKPVGQMTKDDKIRAIQFLNDAGAFLVTKSGDKVSNYFGISKFTLYNYIESGKE